jgi:hypothetical protein
MKGVYITQLKMARGKYNGINNLSLCEKILDNFSLIVNTLIVRYATMSLTRSLAASAAPLDGTLHATADDWRDHLDQEAAARASQPVASLGLFAEFRRKLAAGEVLARALARLAEALRFTGRITISFHQGRVTKTVLEESYFGGDSPG